MERPYDIQDRSFLFATEIVDFCRPALPPGAIVRELARQLLNSGTSIGANLEEADAGQSKPDFRSKVAISRKEARETRYWLRLLVHADPKLATAAAPLIEESRQLINILTAIKLNSEKNEDRGPNRNSG
jgi:four helix bundle protein